MEYQGKKPVFQVYVRRTPICEDYELVVANGEGFFNENEKAMEEIRKIMPYEYIVTTTFPE